MLWKIDAYVYFPENKTKNCFVVIVDEFSTQLVNEQSDLKRKNMIQGGT